jgi:predicted ATPase
VDEARRGLQKLDETRTSLDQTYMMSQMAEVYAVNSQVSDALLVNEKALQLAKKTGERWYQPELLRQRGDLVIAAVGESSTSEAVNQYQRAIEYAKRQNAKSWELRASTSLAGLWSQAGERQKAEDLLASVFESFDEGFDTPDMLEARATLEKLK